MSELTMPKNGSDLTHWPKYSGSLKRSLIAGDDLTTEVPARIEEVCRLYGIDKNNPSWERRLLLTLMHRHIPGFRFARAKSTTVDNLLICESIEEEIGRIETETGIRPSIDSVVTGMLDAVDDDDILKRFGHGRLMRIFSGQAEHRAKAKKKSNELSAALRLLLTLADKMRSLPQDSHARLLQDVFRSRRT